MWGGGGGWGWGGGGGFTDVSWRGNHSLVYKFDFILKRDFMK